MTPDSRLVEYAIASQPLPGEEDSGDRHVVVSTPKGALVAVVDGLGHGLEASEVAQIAVDTIERHAEESVIELVRRCHEEMRRTRGAVMSLASFDGRDHTVTWLGVGNVEGVLLRGSRDGEQRSIMMRSGVVGLQLPVLQALVMPVYPGDALIFATDGIRTGFEQGLCLTCPVQQIADGICARHSKGTDDALVLVARYRGEDA